MRSDTNKFRMQLYQSQSKINCFLSFYIRNNNKKKETRQKENVDRNKAGKKREVTKYKLLFDFCAKKKEC